MRDLKKHASNIRRRIIEESYKNQTAHVGSCLSCVEILTALFFEVMKPGDHFVLSPGHKALALYATLVEKGILKDIDLKKLGGHPIKNPKLGIEFSTGSLGHGLSLACGFALADPKHKVYVLLSEGDMEEGSTYEAANFMFQHKLSIVAIVDWNGWTAYGRSRKRGWRESGSGHDENHLVDELKKEIYPVIFWVPTIKGKGLGRFENKLESHYWKVTKEDLDEINIC